MAMEQDLLTTLRNIQFLHDLPDEYLEPISSVAHTKEYRAGTVIFREGQKESEIYLMFKGAVALEMCAPGQGCQQLQTVGAGELLGWSPLLGFDRVTATARALEPTKVIVIDARQLLALCEHNPRFGYEFMRRTALALTSRLLAARLHLLDVYKAEIPILPDRKDD